MTVSVLNDLLDNQQFNSKLVIVLIYYLPLLTLLQHNFTNGLRVSLILYNYNDTVSTHHIDSKESL